MARVSHPNVVHVYEVGEATEAQGSRVFIAMEYVSGTSLRSHQQAHPYEALYGTLPFPVTSWEEDARTASHARLPDVLPRPPSGIEVPTVTAWAQLLAYVVSLIVARSLICR